MASVLISLACLMFYRPPRPEATEAAIRLTGANPDPLARIRPPGPPPDFKRAAMPHRRVQFHRAC